MGKKLVVHTEHIAVYESAVVLGFEAVSVQAEFALRVVSAADAKPAEAFFVHAGVNSFANRLHPHTGLRILASELMRNYAKSMNDKLLLGYTPVVLVR